MGKAWIRRADKARAAAQVEERRKVVLRVLEACDDEARRELARLVSTGVASSCRAGCAHCCRLEVPVTRAEAETVVHWIRAHCREDEIDRFRARLRAWLRWYRTDYVAAIAAGGDRDDVFQQRGVACALLADDGRCSVYEVRPVTCRNYHVSSPPEACAPEGSGDIHVMYSIPTMTRVHVAELHRVIEGQGGNVLGSVHLLQEWLAHLLDVEREPWIGSPAVRTS